MILHGGEGIQYNCLLLFTYNCSVFIRLFEVLLRTHYWLRLWKEALLPTAFLSIFVVEPRPFLMMPFWSPGSGIEEDEQNTTLQGNNIPPLKVAGKGRWCSSSMGYVIVASIPDTQLGWFDGWFFSPFEWTWVWKRNHRHNKNPGIIPKW